MATEAPVVRAQFPPKLEPLFHMGYRHKAVFGGRGSSKSWSVARYLLLEACRRHARVLCARELQLSLADSVMKLLSDQIEALRLEPFFKVQKNAIYGPNDSEFMFIGLRNNFKEVNSKEGVTDTWLEEAASVSQDSLDYLIPTVLRRAASQIIYTWNPHLESDPIHQKFRVGEPPPKTLLIQMNYQDNPWCPEALLEEMEHMQRTNPLKARWVWDGECLLSSVDALFAFDAVDKLRVQRAAVPPLARIVVAVDPAVTANAKSDRTGIVVAGIDQGRPSHGYVLGDLSGRYSPDAWARRVLDALDTYEADGVTYEVNQGGDLVQANLRNACKALGRPEPRWFPVRATKGKLLRAEPIAALYEQGRVHHVGHLPELEEEMCRFDPTDKRAKSPDRLDALVWALTHLMEGKAPMRLAPSVLQRLTGRH